MKELGPCLVNENGTSTAFNPYGWTNQSNLLVVDQPAGTGFSYFDEGTPIVDNSFLAAADMQIFLQIFVSKVFPQLAKLPLHLAGESYGVSY